MAEQLPADQLQAFAEAIRGVQERAGLAPAPGEDRYGDRRQSYVVGVTSVAPGDGKTTIATGLAGALADDLDVDVSLIGADVHTDAIGEEFRIPETSALPAVLAGALPVGAAAYRLPTRATLRIIPTGSVIENSARMAHSEYAAQFLNQVRDMSRYVVFDLPSVETATVPVLARLCDGVIVVVRAGHTTKQELEQALERLHGSNVLGVVVNAWDTAIPRWLEQSLALTR